MPACPHKTRCGLQRSIPGREALRVWESFYCEGAFLRCERYKLVLLGGGAPDGLLPNGRIVEPRRPAAGDAERDGLAPPRRSTG